MREIKFRACDKKTEKIYNVNFIYFGAEVVALEDEFGEGKTFYRLFNEIELQQFTGLKDKNGKEIYEGDIVEINFDGKKEKGKIVFEENRGRFLWLDNNNTVWGLTSKDKANEVIGNIFDNPELINQP